MANSMVPYFRLHTSTSTAVLSAQVVVSTRSWGWGGVGKPLLIVSNSLMDVENRCKVDSKFIKECQKLKIN